jgi:hypothetical protein
VGPLALGLEIEKPKEEDRKHDHKKDEGLDVEILGVREQRARNALGLAGWIVRRGIYKARSLYTKEKT